MGERKPWYSALLRMLDDSLRSASKTAKKVVRMLRLTRALLILVAILYLSGGPIAFLWPNFLPYYIALVAITFTGAFLGLAFLVGLPLRAKSIVRLVDMGYPKNMRELGIRVVARKLHEESIESEELLVETAWNESKKLLRKYKARAARLKEELDAEPDEGSDSTGNGDDSR